MSACHFLGILKSTVFYLFGIAATARINPLFIDGLEIFDEKKQKIAVISEVSSPGELELIQPDNVEVENIVIDFRGGWQVRYSNIGLSANYFHDIWINFNCHSEISHHTCIFVMHSMLFSHLECLFVCVNSLFEFHQWFEWVSSIRFFCVVRIIGLTCCTVSYLSRNLQSTLDKTQQALTGASFVLLNFVGYTSRKYSCCIPGM